MGRPVQTRIPLRTLGRLSAIALGIAPMAFGSMAMAQACPADLDGSAEVDALDLASLLAAWGPCGKACPSDLDEDGEVGALDLASLLAAWGDCGPQVPAWATLLEALPDPAVVTSAALRDAIVATGYAWRVRDVASSIEMLLVPPGTFDMGCSASNGYGCLSHENPVHAVTLTNAYYMGRYEVTQAQWTARWGSNPSYFNYPSAAVPASQVPNRPVERVSWNHVQSFLAGTGLRLPTEAEWEYAYRAGTTTAFPGYGGQPNGTNDDGLVGNIAWFNWNSSLQTRPVGQKLANGFGLHDMSGNVMEWVNDWWSGTYYESSPPTNPQGPSSGFDRVLRGGPWNVDSALQRASVRVQSSAYFTGHYIGFRVAREP